MLWFGCSDIPTISWWIVEADPLARYLGLLEAATYLRIHPDSLRRLALHGRVPGARKWHGRQWLFERDTLAQFASTYRATPGRPSRGLFPELSGPGEEPQ